jgi:hypothetical protein
VRWFQDEIALILNHRMIEWEGKVAEFGRSVAEVNAGYEARI